MYQNLSTVLTASNRFYILCRCLVFHFVLTSFSAILMLVVDSLAISSFEIKSIISTHRKSNEIVEELGILHGVALITLFVPVVEEIAFRLYLIPNKLAIVISIGILVFSLSGPVFYINDPIAYLIRVTVCISIGILLYYFIRSEKLEIFYNTYRNHLLIVSSILFAGVHIGNFHPIQYEIIFLYPIYVLPQFFMGLILGWLRIQYGFLWGVLFHVLVNGLFTWPKALLMLWNN